MAYTVKNFKTKKDLKAAVAAFVAFKTERARQHLAGLIGNEDAGLADGSVVRPVTCYQPNSDLTGAELPKTGKVYLEGPHYPEPHRWYAEAWLENGEVVKVK